MISVDKMLSFPLEDEPMMMKDETLAAAVATERQSQGSSGGGPGEEGAELVHRGVEVEEKTPGASRHCYISAALKNTNTYAYV